MIVAFPGLFSDPFLPCVIMLFLCLFSSFSIAITSLGEEGANLNAFRTFCFFRHLEVKR